MKMDIPIKKKTCDAKKETANKRTKCELKTLRKTLGKIKGTSNNECFSA